jgi:hypothetical protein
MRVPRWLWLSLLPLLMAIGGDRMRTETRISRLEESKQEVIQRLDRIEHKVDRIIERH